MIKDLDYQKRIGEVIQPFGVGLGALLTGLAGFRYVGEKIDDREFKQERIEDWRVRFPPEKLGDKFKVVERNKQKGVLYVLDLETGKRHWITDPLTLRWLGFSYADVETMSDEAFAKLKRGDNLVADRVNTLESTKG